MDVLILPQFRKIQNFIGPDKKIENAVYIPINANLINEYMTNLEYFINKSIDEGATLMSVNTYAPNPSNINPQREKDKYGTSLDQNLLGISKKGERIIIPDRSVVKIIENRGDKAIVKASISLRDKDAIIVDGNFRVFIF